jgi:hypothetical protein
VTTLLRWAFWLSLIAGCAWVAVTVPLGKRTFVEHLRAIAATREARSLADGTREQAGRLADRVREGIGGGSPEPRSSSSPPGRRAAGEPPARGESESNPPPPVRPGGRPSGPTTSTDQIDDASRAELDHLVRERTSSPRAKPPR